MQDSNRYRHCPSRALGTAGTRSRGTRVEPAPGGSPRHVQKTRNDKAKKNAARNKNQSETRKARSKSAEEALLKQKFTGDKGAMESCFVYVNEDNMCIFPPIMFADSNLRTDPSGSPHFKFLLLHEKKGAQRSCDDILSGFENEEGLRQFDDEDIVLPLSHIPGAREPSYDDRLATAKAADDRITDALTKFADTFFV
jgi:hypothetical protein